MCFTTCYWGLPRRTGRSSSCCHPKSSPTSGRYRTVCLTVFFLLMFPAMPRLISSKWGPRCFCKSSQLPAHTLCCILMKFPLFPVAPFLLHPSHPPSHSSLLPTCLCAHLAALLRLIRSSRQPLRFICSKISRSKMKKTCVTTLSGSSKRWRWWGSSPPPRSSEWNSETGRGCLPCTGIIIKLRSWSYLSHTFLKWLVEDFLSFW